MDHLSFCKKVFLPDFPLRDLLQKLSTMESMEPTHSQHFCTKPSRAHQSDFIFSDVEKFHLAKVDRTEKQQRSEDFFIQRKLKLLKNKELH